ncbi:MAG: RDD family protein [Prevotellaceae bacterium]|jgi:uncharacterized RDD family membrane protein YckC|nr:RDD family protein [Prevotellaceae bacterium]
MAQINTVQNVNINYTLAEAGSRIGARLLDGLFVMIYVIIVTVIAVVIIILSEMDLPSLDVSYGKIIFFLLVFVMYLPAMFYEVFLPYYWQGQTFGKRIVGIRIVREDGSEATLGTYFVRWLLDVVDSFCYYLVGLIVMLSTAKRQRVADLVAKTVVISTTTLAFNQRPDFDRIMQEYKPTFTQVLQLSDKDVRIIRQAYTRARATNNTEIINRLRQKIEQVTSEIRPAMSDNTYIETVLRDYQYFAEQQ